MAVSVGEGKFGYEVAEGWGELPDGFEWGQIGAVSVDSQDQVHMFTRTNHPVMTFARDGKFVSTWGEDVFGDAHGMYIDGDDNLFAVDRAGNKAMKFTKDRKMVFELGNKGQASDTGYTADHKEVNRAAGPFNAPTDVALSANGDFYISDGYGNCRIHKYSASGELLFSWGEPGTDPGQFNIPHNICCDADGWVYVADRENHRVQVFDGNGRFETQWHNMHRPCGLCMATGADPLCYIGELGPGMKVNRETPNLGPRISIMNNKGELLARIGNIHRGMAPNQFLAPHGLAVDSHGDIYVGEVSYTNWPSISDEPVPNHLRTLRKLIRVT